MKKTYILTKDVKCPIVDGHNYTHKPLQVKTKVFRRGQIVRGELKHADNKPAFILVGAMCVIPIDAVKELQGKDIESRFDGADMEKKKVDLKKIKENPKIKYMDALIIGGLLGFVGVYYAEKKGYLTSEDNKYKIYGAIGGALVGMYLVYRNQSKPILKTEQK
jgi:hypothetical protein